jgi:hypothetical protein
MKLRNRQYNPHVPCVIIPEPEFLNVYGAQESIQGITSASL